MNSSPVVLLLEDDGFDVIVLQRSLAATQLPVELQVATDGEQALEMLGINDSIAISAPVQLKAVILDINVPRVSGIDVCARIRLCDHMEHTPVVIFSGSTSPEDAVAAQAAGASAYFDKNTGPAELIDYLKRILDNTDQQSH